MASSGTQSILPLAFGVSRPPKDAPAKILRQVDSAAQALRLSIKAGGHKLAYVGACIGKSEGYVSRMAQGKRPIPDRLVRPLCAATGSNLLSQFLALQAALVADDAAAESRLADELRNAA